MRTVPYFDGSTNYITIPLNPSLLNGCTIEVSILPTNDATNRIIFDTCNATTVQTGVLSSYNGSSNLLQWASEKSTSGTENFNTNTTSAINGQTKVLACVWDGTTGTNGAKLYQDGKLIGQATALVTVGASSYNLCVGALANSHTYLWKGLLYELRIWSYARTQKEIQRDMYKRLTGYEPRLIAYYPLDESSGTTAYDYAVPTYTKSLIDCSGGVLTDKCKRVWTPYGGATVSSAQSKFIQEGYSLYFDGVDDYWSTPYSTDYIFGTENFAIDFWAYPTQYGSNLRLLCFTSNNTDGWQFYLDSSGYLSFTSVQAITITANTTLSTSSFTHVEVNRNGNVVTMYFNGTAVASGTVSFSVTAATSTVFNIGRWYSADPYYYKGYIAQPRITKGKVNHTASFTPPTSPGQIEYQTSYTPNNGTYNGTFSRVQIPEIDRQHQSYSYVMEG